MKYMEDAACRMPRPISRLSPTWSPIAGPQDLSRRPSLAMPHNASSFSPRLHESLSRVHLTTRALRELDRRNDDDQHCLPKHRIKPPLNRDRNLGYLRGASLLRLPCLMFNLEPRESTCHML
ncbi:hypothetical protein F5X97DRAFT_224945 [Nemania serpens]|nr:hypothetical protein F5X97DRAFT_224945 [Nemania serpens]